jgi:hypothetical protein
MVTKAGFAEEDSPLFESSWENPRAGMKTKQHRSDKSNRFLEYLLGIIT